MRRVYKILSLATISASIMAANMWKNSLKNVESDKNKMLNEGESKSKGKIHLTALIEVTVTRFYIFFYIVPLQHDAFVISFN